MTIITTLRTTAALALITFAMCGVAKADTSKTQLNNDHLKLWQTTFDGLRDMTPKWGIQGVEAFKANLDAGVPMVFLDVRTPAEWEEGVIENALLINLNDVTTEENLSKLPDDRNTIIGAYCKAGHRSGLALALLHQLGYKNTISMAGGMDAWREAGYPVAQIP